MRSSIEKSARALSYIGLKCRFSPTSSLRICYDVGYRGPLLIVARCRTLPSQLFFRLVESADSRRKQWLLLAEGASESSKSEESGKTGKTDQASKTPRKAVGEGGRRGVDRDTNGENGRKRLASGQRLCLCLKEVEEARWWRRSENVHRERAIKKTTPERRKVRFLQPSFGARGPHSGARNPLDVPQPGFYPRGVATRVASVVGSKEKRGAVKTAVRQKAQFFVAESGEFSGAFSVERGWTRESTSGDRGPEPRGPRKT